MRKTGKIKLFESARILVIAIALIAITLSGSSFITIRSAGVDKADPSKNIRANIQLSFDLKLPAGGDTVTDKEPHSSGKAIYLTIPAVVSVFNLNEARPVTTVTELRPVQNLDPHHYERLTTAASISPEKAHEFTLVGAKPSGTS